MEKADLPFLSAVELSSLIEKREISPVEATEAYLERIDNLDFKFNAYLTVCRREALEAARAAERAIAGGNYLGPMHGIPVAVKDQFWTQGIRTTGGSRFLAGFIPDEDSTVVANLRRAGAVILGKTNMTEFALLGATQRHSVPRNPWNLDKNTGSSSSGSGAATAAFLCATSLGEDTGGSIRYPATWCGLVGLCPSWGRVSRYGVMRGFWSMDAVGPISRRVEDAAITLAAIAGYDPKDRYTWNAPVPDYRLSLGEDIRGIRMGLLAEQINSELVEPEVRESVVKAVSVLSELGASVEEISLPLTESAGTISSVLQGVETALSHRDWVRDRLQDYVHGNRIALLTGSVIPAQAYFKAQKLRSLLRQQVHGALERYDVLVLPTAGRPAQNIEDDPAITSKHAAMRSSSLFTRIFNLSSMPAISVPCGLSPQGLPIGLQIAGLPGADATVLKLAHAYEQSTSWHTMRPPAA